jgi:hypothetical protein
MRQAPFDDLGPERDQQEVPLVLGCVDGARGDASGDLSGVVRRAARVALSDPEVDRDTDVGQPKTPRERVGDPVADQARLALPRALDVRVREARAEGFVAEDCLVSGRRSGRRMRGALFGACGTHTRSLRLSYARTTEP